MQNFTFHPSIIKSDNGEKLAWLDIYQATTPNHKAVITFYLANSETDSADVVRYKQQVESEILIAIQTHEIDDECLEIADNVLHCQSHEVETILKMFDILPCFKNIIFICYFSDWLRQFSHKILPHSFSSRLFLLQNEFSFLLKTL